MRHIFKAQKIGWREEKEGIWFDAKLFSKEQASAQFKPFVGRDRNGYPYTGYEFGGEKYYRVDYLGKYPKEKMPRSDEDLNNEFRFK